jgi:hypothetical protein
MTALTTPHQISAYRLATLRTALKLETKGMKMGRGQSAYAILKGMGYKGTKAVVLAQVTKDVADAIAAMEAQEV